MATFDQLIDQFLAEEFEDSPVSASGLGLTEFDDRFDDLSSDAFDRRQARAADWGSRLGALADAELLDDFLDAAADGRTATWRLR